MSEAILSIKHWGNSLGIRLPAAVARAANLRVDQQVEIMVEGGRVVISPVSESPLTLEQRLALFDPQRHGGEVMVTESEGVERW